MAADELSTLNAITVLQLEKIQKLQLKIKRLEKRVARQKKQIEKLKEENLSLHEKVK